MTFTVVVGTRTLVVEVRREDSAFSVIVDGTPVTLHVTRSGQGWSVLIDQRSYEIGIAAGPAGEVIVSVDGRVVPVRLARKLPGTRGGGAAIDASTGPQRVIAPMPGRVIKVFAAVGDRGAERQPLLLMEAMKMQNELRAGRPGVLKELHVAEGATVEAGVLLAVVAPED